MSFYTEVAETTTELLKEFGQFVTITRKTPGAYDPATGSVSVTTTTQIGIGAIFNYSDSQTDGTLIQKGDRKLLLSVTGISAPQINDSVIVDSIGFVIQQITTIAPGGIAVMYECQLR